MSKISKKKSSITPEVIQHQIYLIRGHKVMLSSDLAELYGVESRTLVQAVKRNKERFPEDFMFQLSWKEHENLKSQFVTSSWGGIRRAAPYAFTEQGVAMLSSVLRSRQAIEVNIAVMRAFVKLRELLSTHKELAKNLEQLEARVSRHDKEIRAIFEVIRRLMAPPTRAIGYHVH